MLDPIRLVCSAGLTFMQNYHVLKASRDKGAPQISDHKTIYFISQILGSKTHQQ